LLIIIFYVVRLGLGLDDGSLPAGQADVVLLGGAAGAAPDGDDVGEGALDHLAQHGPREEHLEIGPRAHVGVVLVDRRLAGPRVYQIAPRLMLKLLVQPVRICAHIDIYGSDMM
jgi:hypothetical protein